MGVRTIEVRSRLNTEDGDTSDEEDQRSNARADLGLRYRNVELLGRSDGSDVMGW